MHREVCLKHRKNRREISCGCERELAAVFVLFVVTMWSSFKSRTPECQSGDAGASPADRSTFKHTRRAPVRAARSPKPCGLGAAPRRRATFKLRGRQEARQRPHKPSRAGSIPAPATTFPGPLDHSGGHSPRKRESTVQSRGGPPFQIAGRLRTKEAS